MMPRQIRYTALQTHSHVKVVTPLGLRPRLNKSYPADHVSMKKLEVRQLYILSCKLKLKVLL